MTASSTPEQAFDPGRPFKTRDGRHNMGCWTKGSGNYIAWSFDEAKWFDYNSDGTHLRCNPDLDLVNVDPAPTQQEDAETDGAGDPRPEIDCTERGKIVWHGDDEDSGATAGRSLGLGNGWMLWFGEISKDFHADAGIEAAELGDDFGTWIILYGPNKGDARVIGKAIDNYVAEDFFGRLALNVVDPVPATIPDLTPERLDHVKAGIAAAQRVLEAGAGSGFTHAKPLTFTYRNHRGEVAERHVRPVSVHFGTTDWHPEPGWLLRAYDIDKQAEREFAMADIGATPVLADTGRWMPPRTPTPSMLNEGGTVIYLADAHDQGSSNTKLAGEVWAAMYAAAPPSTTPERDPTYAKDLDRALDDLMSAQCRFASIKEDGEPYTEDQLRYMAARDAARLRVYALFRAATPQRGDDAPGGERGRCCARRTCWRRNQRGVDGGCPCKGSCEEEWADFPDDVADMQVALEAAACVRPSGEGLSALLDADWREWNKIKDEQIKQGHAGLASEARAVRNYISELKGRLALKAPSTGEGWRDLSTAPEGVRIQIKHAAYPEGEWIATARLTRYDPENSGRFPPDYWEILHYNGSRLTSRFQPAPGTTWRPLPAPTDASTGMDVEHRMALRWIEAQSYVGRETVTPDNVWEAYQRLNKIVVGIIDRARAALESGER